MTPPHAILLSDLHLNLRGERGCVSALERLLKAHPNAELIFAGDVFEFSTLTPLHSAAHGWQLLRDANPRFCAALRSHLRSASVSFLCGNHDAPLSELEQELRRDLCAATPERLQVHRWAAVRGKTYIEHGHLYDRDNAPLHPLADWRETTEPIGIALMRRFVSARGALDFAHAHGITPAQAVKRAVAQYGASTPWVALRYFATAAALCLEAALPRRSQLRHDRQQGTRRLAAHAVGAALPPLALDAVLKSAPEPTHASGRAVFQRLYFDRVLATTLGIAGLGASVKTATVGAPLLGVAAFIMAMSLRRGASRSSEPVSQ